MSQTGKRLVGALVAVLILAGTAPAASATEIPPPAPQLRGERYCELLIIRPRGLQLTASVWNTFGVDPCEPADWARVRPAVLSWRLAALVLPNGPRVWTVDAIASDPGVERPVRTFGGMAFRFGATIDGLRVTQLGPYRAQRVARRAVFTWSAGATVYELTSPSGRRYIMQSYSRQRLRTLTESDLTGLGRRLRLPSGWRYTTRALSEDLHIDTTAAPAEVLPDDLGNSYTYVPGT